MSLLICTLQVSIMYCTIAPLLRKGLIHSHTTGRRGEHNDQVVKNPYNSQK
jgi:hypothetical protein